MTTQHEAYLDAASAIGRLLVRDALWAGDQCNWLTHTTCESAGDVSSVVTTCGADLATGTLGIEKFLSQLIAIRSDPLAATVLDGVRQQVSSLRTSSRDRGSSNSLHTVWTERIKLGLSGSMQAAQLQRMFAEFCRGTFSHEEHSPVQLAASITAPSTSHPGQHTCFIDPLSADAFLTIAAAATDKEWLKAAHRLADHVLDQTDRFDQPWHGPPSRELAPWGLADGLSGVGHFLLRIAVPSIPPLLSPTK